MVVTHAKQKCAGSVVNWFYCEEPVDENISLYWCTKHERERRSCISSSICKMIEDLNKESVDNENDTSR